MVDHQLLKTTAADGEGQNRQGKDEDYGDLATIDRDSEVSESASPVKVGLLRRLIIMWIVGDTEQCVGFNRVGGEG